jgi:hypothetical protein
MRPYTEAPPQDPSTDGDQPILQRAFGHDETAPHEVQPSDAVADGELYGEPRMGAPGDIHRDDDMSTRHDDEPTDVKSGEVPSAAVTAIWTDDSAQGLRDRWREAQLRFVDDPQQAADDTRHLVNEAVEALTAALASHREQLNSWPANGDTELYRGIVQRYRTFFERLLSL